MGEFVMHRLFPIVCNMSLTASVVILAVLAVRLLLRRAPKVFSYALWAVVLFRLLCPVSVTSAVSLLGALLYAGQLEGRRALARHLRVALPVLLLTARDAVADRVDGLDAGADDYLIKPFDYNRFQTALQKFMARSLTRKVRPSMTGM